MKKIYDIIEFMRQKVSKKKSPKVKEVKNQTIHVEVVGKDEDFDIKVHDQVRTDPQTLFNNLMSSNNLQIDFDVLEGTIPTQYGIIKLEKPTLVVKATYKKE